MLQGSGYGGAPHISQMGENVGNPPHVGYEEMALCSLLGGLNRCKNPPTFRVMTKGYFEYCT
jgi:hypothetical protein